MLSKGTCFYQDQPIHFVGQQQSSSETFVVKLRHNRNYIFKIIEQASSLIYTLINVYIYTAVLIYIIYLCISSQLHGFSLLLYL
jgi:hypothetical protein